MRGILLAAVMVLTTGVTHAETAPVNVELNKLEAREDSCLAYLVFTNDSERRYETFQLDLVMFDTDGIIAHRLAVEAGPLAAGKTVVKMFDIAELPCAALGRVLLNDVIECESADDSEVNCIERTQVTARTEVPFIK